MKLSITMMVKNESKHLRKCLESLQPIMKGITSELIIVDTGSEDNTVEIAKEYTNKVYFHNWSGNFSDMRNISISYAKGEWIFIIDGDEVVENPLQLVNFLKSNKAKQYKSGFATVKSYSTENDELMYGVGLIPRLFINYKGFKYEGVIHEQPKLKLPAYNLGVQLLHYGYISTDKELMERKFQRNIQILEDELAKDPDNYYYWYQVALSYGMHKDYKEALEANIKAIEVAKEKRIDFTRCMYLYTNLAIFNFFNKKYEEAEKVCKEALHIRDGYIDVYYILGKAQANLGKKEESIKNFNIYLKMHDNYHNYAGSQDTGVINYTLDHVEEVYFDLSVLYEKDEEYDNALKYLRKIKSEKTLRAAIGSILNVFLRLNKYDDLFEFYKTKIKDTNDNLKNQFIIYLEKNIEGLSENEKEKVFMLFANLDDNYSILNTVRLEVLSNNPKKEEIVCSLAQLELNDLPNYYGEIIYYLLRNSCNIADTFPNLSQTSLTKYLSFVTSRDDICSLINNYLREQVVSSNLNHLRINNTLANYILLQNQISEEEYRYIFNKYIENGIRYLSHVYNSEVLEQEMIYDLKNSEEAFLTYIYRGRTIIDDDKVQYIRYLRKALKIYPEMKQGIELLMNEVTELINSNNTNNSNNDNIDKTYITQLVNENKTKEALELINKYENIRPDDVEIYSIKAVIAIMENRLEDAQQTIGHGLKAAPHNFDLIYNLAYLKQIKGEYKEAISYYEKAKERVKDDVLRENIIYALGELYIKLELEDKTVQGVDSVKEQAGLDELEDYKKQLKTKIKELIDNSKFHQATQLIRKYEGTVPNDLEILLLKSQVAVAESRQANI